MNLYKLHSNPDQLVLNQEIEAEYAGFIPAYASIKQANDPGVDWHPEDDFWDPSHDVYIQRMCDKNPKIIEFLKEDILEIAEAHDASVPVWFSTHVMKERWPDLEEQLSAYSWHEYQLDIYQSFWGKDE